MALSEYEEYVVFWLHSFVVNMIHHHQAALKLSLVCLYRSKWLVVMEIIH